MSLRAKLESQNSSQNRPNFLEKSTASNREVLQQYFIDAREVLLELASLDTNLSPVLIEREIARLAEQTKRKTLNYKQFLAVGSNYQHVNYQSFGRKYTRYGVGIRLTPEQLTVGASEISFDREDTTSIGFIFDNKSSTMSYDKYAKGTLEDLVLKSYTIQKANIARIPK